MYHEHMFDFTLSQNKIRNTVGLEYHFREGLRLRLKSELTAVKSGMNLC